jgi:hypothetical protein
MACVIHEDTANSVGNHMDEQVVSDGIILKWVVGK